MKQNPMDVCSLRYASTNASIRNEIDALVIKHQKAKHYPVVFSITTLDWTNVPVLTDEAQAPDLFAARIILYQRSNDQRGNIDMNFITTKNTDAL